MTKRTDIHRPSVINPADYTLVDGPEAFHDFGSASGICRHCGHAIRYAVRFTHIPSGQRVNIGSDCANFIDTSDRIAYEIKRMKVAARNARIAAKYEQKWIDSRENMEDNYPDLASFMEDNDWDNEKFSFLISMKEAYDRFGGLTPAQITATDKIVTKRIERSIERAMEPLPEKSAPTGRVTVDGTIISTRVDDGIYGSVRKILVKLTDGNKVWGTCPAEVENYVMGWRESDQEIDRETLDARKYVGTMVEFTASFTVSDKDEHFAFYKRPTKVQVISE
jgi:hypothetical protein